MSGHIERMTTRLQTWAAHAKRGDSLPYYDGFIAVDRGIGDGLDTPLQRAVAELADTAMELAQRGLVHLTQRRVGRRSESKFTYIATRV